MWQPPGDEMPDTQATHEAIAAVIADYVEGMVLADEAKLRRAFHPRACSIGHFAGALEWDGLDAFVAVVLASRDPAAPAPRWKILSTEVTGDTALVKVEDDFIGDRFIDTLTLLHHEGRWQIVAKVFWVAGKASESGR